MLFIIVEYRAA